MYYSMCCNCQVFRSPIFIFLIILIFIYIYSFIFTFSFLNFTIFFSLNLFFCTSIFKVYFNRLNDIFSLSGKIVVFVVSKDGLTEAQVIWPTTLQFFLRCYLRLFLFDPLTVACAVLLIGERIVTTRYRHNLVLLYYLVVESRSRVLSLTWIQSNTAFQTRINDSHYDFSPWFFFPLLSSLHFSILFSPLRPFFSSILIYIAIR